MLDIYKKTVILSTTNRLCEDGEDIFQVAPPHVHKGQIENPTRNTHEKTCVALGNLQADLMVYSFTAVGGVQAAPILELSRLKTLE